MILVRTGEWAILAGVATGGPGLLLLAEDRRLSLPIQQRRPEDNFFGAIAVSDVGFAAAGAVSGLLVLGVGEGLRLGAQAPARARGVRDGRKRARNLVALAPQNPPCTRTPGASPKTSMETP